jgi:DNA-binding XRE family transcriptional regulator
MARNPPRRRSLVQRATERIESVLRRHVTTPETTGSQIRNLRDECRWTIEDLADAAELHERTISRHEADEIQPYARTIRTYERIFSKQLNRKVVINKMP